MTHSYSITTSLSEFPTAKNTDHNSYYLKPASTQYRQLGITLFELIIVLAIIAFLSTTAIPALAHLIRDTQTRIIAGNVFQNVQYARNIALAEHTPVTLCASADMSSCHGSNWKVGGIIFKDINKNGKRESSEAVLKVINPLKNGSQLRWNAFQNKPYLMLTEDGVTNYQNGNFTYCPEDKNRKYAAQIIVSYSGRPRYAIDRNGDGIVNGSNGKNIKCN